MVALASSAARTKLSIASFFVELSSLDCTNNRNVKTISFEYTKNEFYNENSPNIKDFTK